ncbi:MAG: rRNA maturation RNase YbeY [Bacteroidales bacterium]|nr:rRNA maturation RNase YbeY [Bacteroidales bacterium]
MIQYFNNEVDFDLKSKLLIRRWINTVAEQYNKRCKDINIIFCSDPALLEINKQFLGHDYYTDIITFDYCEGDKLSGELYISIDTVRANAVEYEQTFETELHRVIIHGILHLIGFDDHQENDIIQMRRGEEEALKLLGTLLSKKD